MCEHGDTWPVLVYIPADLSHTGEWRWARKPIDRCIAKIVEALQEARVWTRGSCCGHGESDGDIILQDGRKLVIQKWKEDE